MMFSDERVQVEEFVMKCGDALASKSLARFGKRRARVYFPVNWGVTTAKHDTITGIHSYDYSNLFFSNIYHSLSRVCFYRFAFSILRPVSSNVICLPVTKASCSHAPISTALTALLSFMGS